MKFDVIGAVGMWILVFWDVRFSIQDYTANGDNLEAYNPHFKRD